MGKITVKVHKARIEMKTGESINQFISDLSDKAREYVKDKLNFGDNDDSYYYVDEVFGDYVVVYAYIDGEGSTYYAFTYDRDVENDDYDFGKMIEVERKTTFVEKDPVSEVIKSLCGDWVEKSLWKGVL